MALADATVVTGKSLYRCFDSKMDQIHSHFKLRTKLIAGFALLIGILFLASLLIRVRLVEVRDEINTVVKEQRTLELLTGDLDARIDDSIASLGLYVSVREPAYVENYKSNIKKIFDITQNLSDKPAVNSDRQLLSDIQSIAIDIAQLNIIAEQIITIAADDELTYPGLAYANKNINPINRRMLEQLEELRLNEQIETGVTQQQRMLHIADLRYYWINIINGVRAYLAYRDDSVIHDTTIYVSALSSAIDKNITESNQDDSTNQEPLYELKTSLVEFQKHWSELQLIHGSEAWRADSYLMKTKIGPLFEKIEDELGDLHSRQSHAMEKFSSMLLEHGDGITRLADIFLIIGSISGLLMAFGFSRMVTRPILRIAYAMENIAKGDVAVTQRLDVIGNDEVALLAKSFNTISDQHKKNAEEELALSKLLRVSLTNNSLKSYLDEALVLMIENVTWLRLQPKAGIFIKNDDNVNSLKLVSTYNFSPELLELCAEIKFGYCLCGKAAASGKIEYSGCIDHRHEVSFSGMVEHGHYNIPIVSGSVVLGVVVFYLPQGHMRDAEEERFLGRIAEVLGMGISLRKVNSDLLSAKYSAEAANDKLNGITANMPGLIYQCLRADDGTCSYSYVSSGSGKLLGAEVDDPYADINRLFNDVYAMDKPAFDQAMRTSWEEGKPINIEYRIQLHDGDIRWMLCNASPRVGIDGGLLWDGILLDITHRKMLENQLLQAQKLESVGQLAAGIAHEINTPTQFVQDNTNFLKDAFSDYNRVLKALCDLRDLVPVNDANYSLANEADRIMQEVDINYLIDDVPQAISQSLEGLQRISSIVSAMKDFTHPGTEEKQAIDINAVINNIITVSRNEWKYVADIETELDADLSMPKGYRDKIGQVILNLIVNAAHAIGDQIAEKIYDKGKISISTRNNENKIEIRVCDNGPGVPPSIARKIFDPFFTTKEVGKGTGQGLSIARSVVVDQHHGEMLLESPPGGGATFVIILPVD